MKKIVFLLIFCASAAVWAAEPALIPRPTEAVSGGGEARLPSALVYGSCPQEAESAAAFYNRMGKGLQTSMSAGTGANLELTADASLGAEAYTLAVEDGRVRIAAGGKAGFVYAFSALLQLQGLKPSEAVSVSDAPFQPWRGFMLDSARHFQSAETVLALLDKLAFSRINRLHWHLSDNDGWRIESRKYPKLNEIASNVGRYPESERNGFYTVEEIHRVLDRAAELGITVYPEIDLPGHAAAFVEAYPEFLCPTNPSPVPVKERLSNAAWTEILCVANPDLFPFLTGVLDEVIEIFRNPEYFHMGGDEVPLGIWEKCPLCSEKMKAEGLGEKELLTAFLKQYAAYLEGKGITPVYWCEYPSLKISDRAIAQVWRAFVGKSYLKKSLKAGIRTLNACGDYAYLDYPEYPGMCKSAWMPLLPLKKVYNYPYLPSALTPNRDLFIGGACTMWTEEINEEAVDETLFPRLFAVSEQLWTEKSLKNFKNFEARLNTLRPVFAAVGIGLSEPPSREKLRSEIRATVECDVAFANNTWPEYAVNGRDADAFVSASAPKEGQSFTVIYDEPKHGSLLQIISGGFFIHDAQNGRIDDGTPVFILTSPDGEWTQTASFEKGIAEAEVTAPVYGVRIGFLNEDERISVNEIVIK